MYIVSDKTTVATYPNRIRAQPFTKRHHCQWLPCMHYLQAEFLILTCYQQLHDRSSLTEDCKCLQEAPAPPVQQSTLHPSQTKQRDLQLLKSFRVPEKKSFIACLTSIAPLHKMIARHFYLYSLTSWASSTMKLAMEILFRCSPSLARIAKVLVSISS